MIHLAQHRWYKSSIKMSRRKHEKVLKMIGKILGIILLVILVIGIIVYAFVLQYPKLKDDPKVGKSLYGYRWKGKDFVS